MPDLTVQETTTKLKKLTRKQQIKERGLFNCFQTWQWKELPMFFTDMLRKFILRDFQQSLWGFFIQAKAYPVRFQLKSNSVFMLCAKLLTKYIEVFDSHSRSPLRYNVKISGLLCLRPRISNASQLSNNAMSWPHSAGKHGDYVPFMAINIKWNATRLARTLPKKRYSDTMHEEWNSYKC